MSQYVPYVGHDSMFIIILKYEGKGVMMGFIAHLRIMLGSAFLGLHTHWIMRPVHMFVNIVTSMWFHSNAAGVL